jgi:ubiquitin carboxyl-terminal hydrolase 34
VGVQQDAQEFLNMLFDKIEQSLKPTPFRHIADSIYGGKYCNQFICSNCKHVIERHENFFSLSLEVKGQKTIQDSFKKFITGEVISDYKCDNCDKKTDTAKRCFISGLPNYLFLYLQRICFNYDKFENEKINTRWEFPHQLNLFDYTIDKEKGLETS